MKSRDMSIEQMLYNSMTIPQKMVYNAKRKVTGAVVGAGLAGLLSACGPNSTPNPESPVDPSYELAENVSPAEGSYSGDGTVVFGVTLPEANPDYDGEVTSVSVDMDVVADNGTPSDESDDFQADDIIHTDGQPGEEITQSVDLSTMYADGEAPESETLTATVNMTVHTEEGDIDLGSMSIEYTITREGGEDRAVVEHCYISGSEVGRTLSIDCIGSDSQGRELTGNWSVSGGPDGTEITRRGAIGGTGELQPSDISDYDDMFVSVLDSTPYQIHLSVSQNRGYILFNDGTELQMPEEDVVELLTDCASNYSGQETGVFNNNDIDCIQEEFESWPADRQTRFSQYNNVGETISDVYAGGDVESATLGIGQRPSLE